MLEKQSHSCVFKMIDKIGNLLAGLNKGQEEITNIGNKRGDITTDPTEKIRITREYYKQSCANKFNNLGKVARMTPPRQKDTNYPN